MDSLRLLLVINIFIVFLNIAYAAETIKTAPVYGFAQSFLTTAPIADASILVLETGATYKTNKQGQFGPILYPIGKPITLIFAKQGFITVQSETFTVPKEGLTDVYHQISFQVPSALIFRAFLFAMGGQLDEDSCHVVTTITAKHKTLADIPQGEVGATVTLHPNVNEKPFYFDMFKFTLIYGKTNPFTKGLQSTTEDGGVAYINIPTSDKLYTLSAEKSGHVFSSAHFLCRKGAFINISPPRGPSIL